MSRADRLTGDPRGETWARDTSKFGYRMLQKMGWTEGKGLGAKEDGVTSHVKIVKKHDNAGVGVDHSAKNKVWLNNSFDYNAILGNLNQAYGTAQAKAEDKDAADKTDAKKEEAKPKEEEGSYFCGKKKGGLIYKKIAIARNVRRYSKEDMSAILGGIPFNAPAPAAKSEEDAPKGPTRATSPAPAGDASLPSSPRLINPDESSQANSQLKGFDTVVGLQTTTSSSTIHDYFKQKMAQLQRNNKAVNLVQDESGSKGTESGEEMEAEKKNDKEKKKKKKSKKDKKKKTTKKRKRELLEQGQQEKEENNKEQRQQKKKKKTKKRKLEQVVTESKQDKENKKHKTQEGEKTAANVDGESKKQTKKKKKKKTKTRA